MHSDHSPPQRTQPRQRTSAPQITIAFVEGPESETILHGLARALARRAARQLFAQPERTNPAADNIEVHDG